MKKQQEEKIDFVITWVDGNDKAWQLAKEKQLKKFFNEKKQTTKNSYNVNRYRDWGTLKYWFRGVEKYASWVNKIYFVTCGQLPEWLDVNNEKIVIVNHSDFMPPEDLPTFNSEAIEINLYKIKNLNEKFVYFNDDLFITNNVKPNDFFKNGKPCETATLGIVPMTPDSGYTDYNNTRILNKYFNKKTVIKNNFTKWINFKYGYKNIKTLLLLPWNSFTGMNEYHICNSLMKSTFIKLWNLENQTMKKTSSNRFRGNDDVNLWLLKNWEILSGNFFPRNYKFGMSFCTEINKKICDCVEKGKYKIICINDHKVITSKQFITQRDMLINSFEKKFPIKSTFEK